LFGHEVEMDSVLNACSDVCGDEGQYLAEGWIDRIAVAFGVLIHPVGEGLDDGGLLGAPGLEPSLRAIRDIFGAHRYVVLNIGISHSRTEILRGPAAGGCSVHQDRLGMVFHFRITEAANDGQQVRAVNRSGP